NDLHEINICVKEMAHCLVSNQAATLVYPGVSKQTIDISIEDGATLCFVLHPLILAKGAAFTQEVNVRLRGSAGLRFTDSWYAGRFALRGGGEVWQFESFQNTINIFRDERLVYREHWKIYPNIQRLKHPFLCGDY